ncbi:MAG: DUF3500 domain-containing protein [Candidatus Omnitrophica bacterium]|nr:DUF3500 domain-containing protein [Candidatus Omnitrophota bacterium]
MIRPRTAVAAGLVILSLTVTAVKSSDQHPAVTEITETAGVWFDSLDNRQQVAVSFPFDDRERLRWHYFPHSGAGLTLREMSEEQRGLAADMIRAVLSTAGAQKVEEIMALETILQQLEGNSPRYRDPLRYAFTLYGQPGEPPWGWRVDGHHLAVNVTVATERDIVLTPLFLGTNPAKVPRGPFAGKQIQKDEAVRALTLVNSLSAEQRGRAVLRDRSVGNILAGPGQLDRVREFEGIRYTDLTEDQRRQLMELIEVYVGAARDDIGHPYLELIRADLLELYFAWAGGTREGDAYYYRIHGPRVLIEFDNTQNNGNHIHSVWRDPLNDFGRDVLREHYLRAH